MKKNQLRVQKSGLMVFLTVWLIACGGGGGGGSTTTTLSAVSSDVENTADLVATRDFSFEVIDEITLTISNSSGADGALHIYTQQAFEAESGVAVGEPMSRITTIHPLTTSQVILEVNQNWEMLYAHWVPMSADESEQHLSITLDQSNKSYHVEI